jgi:hypothetical protein
MCNLYSKKKAIKLIYPPTHTSDVACKGKVVPVQDMEVYEVAEVELCSFLTLALDVDDWPISQSLCAH